MYLVFFRSTDNNFFFDDPPDAIFQKNIHAKYLQIVVSIHFIFFI